jgi:hypothetical protein
MSIRWSTGESLLSEFSSAHVFTQPGTNPVFVSLSPSRPPAPTAAENYRLPQIAAKINYTSERKE